jgi:hypothetical protein
VEEARELLELLDGILMKIKQGQFEVIKCLNFYIHYLKNIMIRQQMIELQLNIMGVLIMAGILIVFLIRMEEVNWI